VPDNPGVSFWGYGNLFLGNIPQNIESVTSLRNYSLASRGTWNTAPHLEVHGNRGTGPLLFLGGRQQFDLGAYLRLLHPAHSLHSDETKKTCWRIRNKRILKRAREEIRIFFTTWTAKFLYSRTAGLFTVIARTDVWSSCWWRSPAIIAIELTHAQPHARLKHLPHRAPDWISKRFTPRQVSMVTFWRVLSTNCDMGVKVLYSKLNISALSCSFFLKFSGKIHVNKPNTSVNFLGKRPCVKEVLVF